jgi:membrane protein YqaA with SNARE-associated domain
MKAGLRQNAARILILLFVVGVTISLFVFRDRFANIRVVGYPVLFLLGVVTNATLILPLPGVALASVMGANPSFNPLWVAVVLGLGSAVGELTGYLAGYSGQVVVEKAGWYHRIQEWMSRYGSATIFALAFIPNPLFDVAGFSAGVHRIPVLRFLFFCSLGKILKMLLFAYGGAGIVRLLPGW